MNRLIIAFFILTAPSLLAAPDGDDVRAELKSLEGKWKAVAMEAAGTPFPKDSVPDFTFIIAGDGKSIGKMPQSEFRSVITVNPKMSPKTIDNLHETGNEKGKMQYGVYKLDGDKFTVCMSRAGSAKSDRPKDFSSKDTTNVVFVFERVKEDKKP